ncbi:MAG: sulfotransferase family protein [Candidatus Promineifilaceae bacterium]
MFKRLFGRKPTPITIVSGLPRSGTSMMMKMLEAGGIPIVQDGIRTANVDNPKGYYEFERVKQLPKGDFGWMPDASGKAVKIISALLKHLPAKYEYQILFMRRDLDEVVASQSKMLTHRSAEKKVEDAQLKLLFSKHLRETEVWLRQQKNVTFHNVRYRELVQNPQMQLPPIVRFLNRKLSANDMLSIVDTSLYRNRQS